MLYLGSSFKLSYLPAIFVVSYYSFLRTLVLVVPIGETLPSSTLERFVTFSNSVFEFNQPGILKCLDS
jgi:hypothetical protein